MQWGGSLGPVLDTGTQLVVEVRSFGTFEGDVQPGTEGAISAVVVDAVRGALAGSRKGVATDPRDLARSAQALAEPRLAAMGIQGSLTVAAVSVSEEDRERLQAAALAAAQRMRDARAAAAAPVPFAVGAGVLVQWSDGQRYPGTVRETAPQQVLVGFADGAQHWVPLQYVGAR